MHQNLSAKQLQNTCSPQVLAFDNFRFAIMATLLFLGVYLTNPLEIVCEDTLMEQLTSDSVLLVRRQDVVSRFQPSVSLAPLIAHADPRWCTMNVLG